MMLGDLLAAARDSTGAFQLWLESSDPGLAAEVKIAAEREQMSPAGFVRAAVTEFSRFAAEEDWATLTSSLRDSSDPGTICLLAMVHWRLNVRACDHHGFHTPRQHGESAHERPQPRPAQ